MIASKMRQRLQEISQERYARLQVVETKARQLAEFSQGGGHLAYTPHGLSHISAVEQNYNWLLSDDDIYNFNASEIFCLLCATFFHDSLMIPKRSRDEEGARAFHIERAKNFLQSQRDILGLTLHESDAISEVIRGHGVSDISDLQEHVALGTERLDLRKLGACLALSDICHADASRAPEIVFRHLDMNEDSRSHWRRHLQISGITRYNDTIIISALAFSDEGELSVKEYKKAIEDQLIIIRPYFQSLLWTVRRVELTIKRLDSPLDQTLHFQTNTPAIIKVLIDGVYNRHDVFVRELVQNSLDTCLVRRMKQSRRNITYEPKILLTIFEERKNAIAFRIDDNGTGMDLNDVQDTVLLIGSSISSREDLVTLLQETLGKGLIATFGIGLLSCFKASSSIKIRTAKENATPIQFTITGISDNIKPEKSTDKVIGTTIVVDLSKSQITAAELKSAVGYYFRRITQADLRLLSLPVGVQNIEGTRDEIFKIAHTESQHVAPRAYYAPGDLKTLAVEIVGDDFSGAIWLPKTDLEEVIDQEGRLEILNEGIFVAEEASSDWLPQHLKMCNGVFNFSAKAISLPAGRDRVIQDDRMKQKVIEIGSKSTALIDSLVERTKTQDAKTRDNIALILSYMFIVATEDEKRKIVKRLDGFNVREFRQERFQALGAVKQAHPSVVYLEYRGGRRVTDLVEFDGKTLYHRSDDLVELQASLKAQQGDIVLSTVRDDSTEADIIEAELIAAYLAPAGIKTVDFMKSNVLEGTVPSQRIPASIRKAVGSSIKFIEVTSLPNRRAWRVGNEVWVNTAHPSINKVVESIRSIDKNEKLEILLAKILLKLIACQFDSAIEDLCDWFDEPRDKRGKNEARDL